MVFKFSFLFLRQLQRVLWILVATIVSYQLGRSYGNEEIEAISKKFNASVISVFRIGRRLCRKSEEYKITRYVAKTNVLLLLPDGHRINV